MRLPSPSSPSARKASLPRRAHAGLDDSVVMNGSHADVSVRRRFMEHAFLTPTFRAAGIAVAALCIGGTAAAQDAPASTTDVKLAAAPAQLLPQVVIAGNYVNAIGTSDAASQGSVTAKLLESRPTLRPAEVLEFVPGVIVTQHSGDGKANQYFLRGFNLDHGTDFATWVDGMPVNMPTHAHGHGYSDLNWLIPELVNRISYKKGPYFADEGDFSSAGAAHIDLVDTLPRGIASLTLGGNGYGRSLLSNSSAVGAGQLLYALEAAHNDGPWDSPEKFHRINGVLRYSVASDSSQTSLTATAYDAGWNATDQVPQRAVDSGLIGRFGTLDASDGGNTSRFSLSASHRQSLADGEWRANAYAIRSRLQLFSDFSFFAQDPVNGDQFEQAENRDVFGLGASRTWNHTLHGHDSTTTIGTQLRHDRLDPVGLSATARREHLSTTQESRVRQTSLGLYAENSTQWTPWLRSVAGLRADRFDFKVASSIAENSGHTSAGIASPKLSLIFGPWNKTEFFANLGQGFHSNDARGTTAAVTAKAPRDPVERVDALVRSRGGELGVRTEAIPGLQSSLALWRLSLGSELVFVGDAGETEPNRASRRQGIEWNNHYVARPWLLFDADLSVSSARFTDADPIGNHVPGAIRTVASFGATVTEFGPWFGQFQLRYFGPRPLVEDDSQRSKATALAYLRAGYRINRDVKIALDVFNLFNRRGSDIDYFYASQLKGEASPVDDIHFHPVEPRSVRLTLTANF
jgi:outer membrane receptor protein involved in Fe transport